MSEIFNTIAAGLYILNNIPHTEEEFRGIRYSFYLWGDRLPRNFNGITYLLSDDRDLPVYKAPVVSQGGNSVKVPLSEVTAFCLYPDLFRIIRHWTP
jgi:hypothetical protein